MKVLITGATGLVGQELVAELHKKKYHIHCLTTRKDKLQQNENFKGFLWNPKQGEIDIRCFDGVSTIVNLAGATIAKRWTPAYKKEILDSRVASAVTLRKGLSNIPKNQIKYLVNASAIGIYPNSLDKFYEEDHAGIDGSFLGEVVHKWEKAVDQLQDDVANLAKVRIGLVLSKTGGALPQMANPIKNYVGAPLGNGNQWLSWIHNSDLARMFVYLIENTLEGTYNGVAPNPVTNRKLTKELAITLKRPLWLPNVPAFALKLVLGRMAYLLLTSQRVSSKKIQEEGFDFQYPNICSAFEAIYHGGHNMKKLAAT